MSTTDPEEEARRHQSAVKFSYDRLSAEHEARERLEEENVSRKAPAFRITYLPEILDRPDVPYVLPGWLPEIGIGIIFGAEYTGKSLLAMALAGSVSTGAEWLGLTPAVTGPVIYCMGEGQAGLGQRMRAMIRGHLAGETPQIAFAEEPFPLTPALAERFCQYVKPAIPNPRAIVFDAKMDFYEGAENSNDDSQQLVKAQKLVRDFFGCAVIVVDHAGNEAGDRNRGASRFRQAQDFRWQVSKGKVACQKNKEGSLPDPLNFSIQRVGGTQSATIRPVSADELETRHDNRDAEALAVVAANPELVTRSLLALLRPVLGVSQGDADKWLKEKVEDGTVTRVKGDAPGFTYSVT